MIRPRIPQIRKKPAEKMMNSYVFDSANEMNKVAEIVSELERIKFEFKNKINNLEKIAEETRIGIDKKLNQLSDSFVKKALLAINEDTVDIINQYKAKIQEIENEIERVKTIQKGDKGDRGNDGKDGKDGISPDINLIVKNVLKLIPLPKDGKDAFVDEKEIAEKILQEIFKKGLEIKNIKNLEETLRHLSSKTMLGGMVKGGGGSWHQKALTGAINGTNTVFTFSGVKPSEFSERIFINYVEQNPVNGDYTINYETQTVTYATAPDASLSGLPHTIRYHA